MVLQSVWTPTLELQPLEQVSKLLTYKALEC